MALCFSVGGDLKPLANELDSVYDQTPTLLRWVSRGLDPDVQALLNRDEMRSDTTTSVVHSEKIVAGRAPTWWSSWYHAGSDITVRFVIGGNHDPRVSVLKGGSLLMSHALQSTRQRRSGMRAVPPDDDPDLRTELVRRIGAAIALVQVTWTMIELSGHVEIPDLSPSWQASMERSSSDPLSA